MAEAAAARTSVASAPRAAGSAHRGFWVTRSAAAPRIARAYFAAQAIAGALWWVGVFTLPWLRRATLGELDPVAVALWDVPLFVIASGIAAAGRRWAVRIAVPWTLLVTAGLAGYATATGLAGWGALLMAAASCGSLVAWSLAVFGRIPAETVLRGPLASRTARVGSRARQLATTLLQMLGFWVLFLGVLPLGIRLLEVRCGLHVGFPAWLQGLGWVVLLLASALGVTAAAAMSLHGDGTPLPSATAVRLVIAGPYRWVRNPMALSGIAQAAGVGLLSSSWLVLGYAVCGGVYWNEPVRPSEEAELEQRFGEEFTAYRDRVRCWAPCFG
ncbi:methyltransferase family protein [Leucobacter sp. UCD-THU]|uniref:methyltransferase family protein n=1 Tax=Leucobacter sp. UCD-THU TaxID=1292023 RepID=UPI00037878E8|nr:isoprenylcysteine carboxylmethyltransferase family protein [Leucobacter sp. UCD-THU]